MNNNERSNPINITKGNFQGCPLSPLFFVLAIEVLAVRIRNNKEIIGIKHEDICKKINLVADDILLIFKNFYSGISQVQEELKVFSSNSGLKINCDKCTVTRICPHSSYIELDTLPSFQRKKDKFTYIGMECTIKQDNLWENNIPDKLAKMATDAHSCAGWSEITTIGRITVVKSLFFSRFPYFLELVSLPPSDVLKRFQQTLNDLIWNGKKPKMKLNNATPRPSKGGLGMINIQFRYQAIKIDLLHCAADISHLQFWQAHLFSHFSIGFDKIISCNLTYKSLQSFIIKPLSLFWQEVFTIWCNFHFRGCSHSLSKTQIQEVIARPAYFNSAFGSSLLFNKRWSNRLYDFFIEKSWFAVSDLVNPVRIPLKGFISRAAALKIHQSIPSKWRNTESNNSYTIAQKLLDQKLRQREIYDMLIDNAQESVDIVRRWVNEGCTINFFEVSKSVSKLKNGNLQDFFIRFNAHSVVLTVNASYFAPTSNLCSLCKSFKETQSHLFWECPKSQYLWKYVHSLVPSGFHSKEMSLFPMHAPEKVVFLFTLCKYYLNLCRIFKRDPHIKAFKNKLIFHLRPLKATYTINDRETKFNKIWGDLFCQLTI